MKPGSGAVPTSAGRLSSVTQAGGCRRLGLARLLCRALRCDWLLFAEPAEVLALSGFDLVGTFYLTSVLVPASGVPVLFTFRAERDLAAAQSWIAQVVCWSHGEDPLVRLLDVIRARTRREAGRSQQPIRLGVAKNGWLTVCRVEALEACSWLELVEAGSRLAAVASVPADEQRTALHGAAAASLAALDAGSARASAGVDEAGIAAAMAVAYWHAGAGELTRPMSVASGPRTPQAHALPGDRVLEPGDRLNLCCWGSYHRSPAVFGTTAVVGPPGVASGGHGDPCGSVLAAMLSAGMAAAAPGASAGGIAEAMLGVPDAGTVTDRRQPLGYCLGLSYPRRPHRFRLETGRRDIVGAGDVIVLAPAAPGRDGSIARVCLTCELTAGGVRPLPGAGWPW
jgi:Xaa-Pro aminopeptidase